MLIIRPPLSSYPSKLIFMASNNTKHTTPNMRLVDDDLHYHRPSCKVTNGNNVWSNVTHLTPITSSKKQFCFPAEDGGMDKLLKAHETKMEDLRPLISSEEMDPLQSFMFVDATQRLGVDYHFQEEIETILQRHYVTNNDNLLLRNLESSQTLLETSLCFRLLRQQGHNVRPEMFDVFKDKNGKFHEELSRDTKGLMELYEAAQLNYEGEEILFEAEDFSRKHLTESLKHLDETEAKMVRKTLKHPHHKSLSKFMAKTFLEDFKGIYRWVEPLKELATMEFMMTQRMHRHEVSQILRWWKDLDLIKDLQLARDQPIKWYTWTMATVCDPKFSELRVEATKFISFVYIIDDIFDIYGTVAELALFTKAINRWDLEADEVDELPEYMKTCFKALYNVTNETGNELYRKYGHNPVNLLQQMWANLCDAFLEETKWFASRDHVPGADEYLTIAKVTSGVHVIMVHIFFLLGLGAPKENNAMCLNDTSEMISSVATILRLWDDLGSAKDEKQDGHDRSYVNYYVQEHGVTVECAREHVLRIISNEWKQLNRESLRLHKSSSKFSEVALNSARMVPLMYDYDDDQSLPLLEAHIKSELFDDYLPLGLVL